MASYAASADCVRLYNDILIHVAAGLDIDDYIAYAHDWLVDTISPYFTPPAAADASQLLVLAEANYAVFLILRADGEDVTSLSYQEEAWSLVKHLAGHVDTGDAAVPLPQSSSTNTEPEFSTGKHNTDGDYLGNKSGISDDNKGSLDDW